MNSLFDDSSSWGSPMTIQCTCDINDPRIILYITVQLKGKFPTFNENESETYILLHTHNTYLTVYNNIKKFVPSSSTSVPSLGLPTDLTIPPDYGK